MADKKISELTALTSPADADEIEIIDKSDNSMAASGTNKKITATNLIPKATDAETETGTDANKLVTPAGLNSIILDEDDMSSDSDTEISTQQSIKAYIDSGVWNDGWIVGDTMTYVSATTFSVTGDQTGKYHKGCKIKLTNDSTTKTYYVSTSAYTTVTTVTIAGEVDLVSGSITNPHYSYADCPQGFKRGEDWYKCRVNQTTSQSISTTAVTATLSNEIYDVNSNFNTSTYKYEIPISGYYAVDYQVAVNDCITNNGLIAYVSKDAGNISGKESFIWSTGSFYGGPSSSINVDMVKGDHLFVTYKARATTTDTTYTPFTQMCVQFTGV